MTEDWSGSTTDPCRADTCRVAVFYQDTAARERAVALGHHLVEHFWSEIDFDFSWWRFRYLEDPEIADAAAGAAAQADVLVFSAPSVGPPPSEVRMWLELWIPHRAEVTGVVVPLLYPSDAEAMGSSPWIELLENLGRATGLECLLPTELRESHLFSDAVRRLQQRATQRTDLLEGILQQRSQLPPPVHWGLNE